MAFKVNISEKSGKTFHLETEGEELVGKELGNKIQGKDVSPDLEGYEFEITGTSDSAGFTSMKDVEGIGLKKVLLNYGKGMHLKPKGDKKKNKKPSGLRLRKTARGKVISKAIIQINLKVLKEGNKKLAEIFPDQCKPKETEGAKPAEGETKEPTETKPVEQAQPDKEPKETEKKVEEASQPEKEPAESETKVEEASQPEKEPKSE